MAKNLVSGLISAHLAQILSVTRYHGQLSSRTISEKTNDPILRKLSDRQMNRQMDRRTNGQMEQSDFIRRCPNNIMRPI